MSHYKTLRVEPTATPEEIKAAFRRLAARYHPDKNLGEAARMLESYEFEPPPQQMQVQMPRTMFIGGIGA